MTKYRVRDTEETSVVDAPSRAEIIRRYIDNPRTYTVLENGGDE